MEFRRWWFGTAGHVTLFAQQLGHVQISFFFFFLDDSLQSKSISIVFFSRNIQPNGTPVLPPPAILAYVKKSICFGSRGQNKGHAHPWCILYYIRRAKISWERFRLLDPIRHKIILKGCAHILAAVAAAAAVCREGHQRIWRQPTPVKDVRISRGNWHRNKKPR